MTALSKLFRTTAFRLSLTYLALFSAAAIVAMFYIYWNTTVLLQRQLSETIDAELQGLAEQYKAGRLDQLIRTVADRVAHARQQPLSRRRQGRAAARRQSHRRVAAALEQPRSGRIRLSPPGAWRHRAASRLRQCVPPAGRLPPDRRPRHRGPQGARAHHPLRHAVGPRRHSTVRHRRRRLGEPQAARAHRCGVGHDANHHGGRPHRAPAGQRLGRRARPPVGKPQPHARAHRAADGGLARGLRQYRARPQDAAQPPAQPRRGGFARA